MTTKKRSAFAIYSSEPVETPAVEEKTNYWKKKDNYQNQKQPFKKQKQFKENQNGLKVKLENTTPNDFNLNLNGHNAGITKRNKNKNKKMKKKLTKLLYNNNSLKEALNLVNQNETYIKQEKNQQPNTKSWFKKNLKTELKQFKQFDLPKSLGFTLNSTEIINDTNSKQTKKKFNKKNKNLNEIRKVVIENHHNGVDNDHNKELESDIFDSRKEAIKLFNKIISPHKHTDFFREHWEKKPILIKRQTPEYYKNWFSCKEFDYILRNNYLEFTQNVDVTTYINGEKKKHNPEGRAYAPLVWDFYQQGCSIRLLNPQTYSKNVWFYLSTLQELFGTCVGANTYLTPPGTQGFAPHYDDIEAFVLQLEGKKRWRVYSPLTKEETLPRFSSKNFDQSEIGEPLIDCILESGDLLYFPRGFIHQANACDDMHSLHITVSCYQKNTWGDYLSKLLPAALEVAMEEDVEFRMGLPINYLNSLGCAFEKGNKDSHERIDFAKRCTRLIKKLADYVPIDDGVDQMGKQLMHDTLPPCLTEDEKSRSIHGHGEKWNENKNRVDNIAEISPDTAIKLVRKNCLRLVQEGDSFLVYHNLDNTRIYQEKEPQFLEVEPEAAPAIEFLIKMYPKYVTVEQLPLKSLEEKAVVASCLYDKGLIVTGEPLAYDFEENSEDDEEDEYIEDKRDMDDDSEDEDSDGFNSEDYDRFDQENKITNKKKIKIKKEENDYHNSNSEFYNNQTYTNLENNDSDDDTDNDEDLDLNQNGEENDQDESEDDDDDDDDDDDNEDDDSEEQSSFEEDN